VRVRVRAHTHAHTGEACGVANIDQAQSRPPQELVTKLGSIEGQAREFLKEALAEIAASSATATAGATSCARGGASAGHEGQVHGGRVPGVHAKESAKRRDVHVESTRRSARRKGNQVAGGGVGGVKAGEQAAAEEEENVKKASALQDAFIMRGSNMRARKMCACV